MSTCVAYVAKKSKTSQENREGQENKAKKRPWRNHNTTNIKTYNARGCRIAVVASLEELRQAINRRNKTKEETPEITTINMYRARYPAKQLFLLLITGM